jgi:hypothetical protein
MYAVNNSDDLYIYKYRTLLSLHIPHQALEDGPYRGFRNIGQYKPDAGETPESWHT